MVKKNKLPGKILTVSIIEFFFAFASLMLFDSSVFEFNWFYIILGAVFLIIYTLLGLGLLFLNKIARISVLIFAWIDVVSSVYNLLDYIYINALHTKLTPVSDYAIIVAHIILSTIIIVLLQNKEIKKYFK